MKLQHFVRFLPYVIFSSGALAQTLSHEQLSARADVDSALAPFFHGVASGDPLSDRVIIWTRVTTNSPDTLVTGSWEMALDTGMTQIVQSGAFTTQASRDFTVRIDVTGLQPNTWYYYRFEHNGAKSLRGRTRTLPTGDTDSIRVAVASCQSFTSGFYNIWNWLSKANEVDAIFFLGDFIYEYGGTSTFGRDHDPPYEILNLTDYRTRHSQHRLDKDLREALRQYPIFSVWDDHEVANNAWRDGAENHTPSTEGDYQVRKTVALQAYSEWMPLRYPNPGENVRIFRRFHWGNLIDVHFLDTRLFDRDEPFGSLVSANDAALNDTSRKMLGPEQRQWLFDGLSSGNGLWKVLAQQVMMAPLQVFGLVVNGDQWDGYPAERKRLWDFVMNNSIQNLVVFTGDIHTAWAMDLPYTGYNPSTGANSVGVEFVTTSVTSGNAINIPGGSSLIQSANPHIKFVDLEDHGLFIADFNKQRVQADFIFTQTITEPDNINVSCPVAFYSNAGERFVRQAASCVTQKKKYPPLAPPVAPSVSIKNPGDLITAFNVWPNPTPATTVVQFSLSRPQEVVLRVTDVQGNTVYVSHLGFQQPGLRYAHFDASAFKPGYYFVYIEGSGGRKGCAVLKN
ncbi:MAG: alkaline phosphatase D family protein [Flavobacteriales bacterium]|nr:alkaline phosphatase D family protein [Flavobacteriales bacterium]MDW8432258.1 alkaline phosphatase D family protein [Flavobacteriales bacterium]